MELNRIEQVEDLPVTTITQTSSKLRQNKIKKALRVVSKKKKIQLQEKERKEFDKQQMKCVLEPTWYYCRKFVHTRDVIVAPIVSLNEKLKDRNVKKLPTTNSYKKGTT